MYIFVPVSRKCGKIIVCVVCLVSAMTMGEIGCFLSHYIIWQDVSLHITFLTLL